MIICITDKFGLVHVVDFDNDRGRFRTICSKTINKTDNVNLFAADSAIKTGCAICHSFCDKMITDDLNTFTRLARSRGFSHLSSKLVLNKKGVISPEIKYVDRHSNFMSKLQNKCRTKYNKYVPPISKRR